MILVAGGTGRLGSLVTRRLLSEGEAVRVMTRTPERAEALKTAGAEIVQGDVRDPQSLARPCRGAQQVVASVQALTGSGENNPQTVDLAGLRQLIDAAKAAGAGHFVYVSVQGATADGACEWVRVKHAAEQYLAGSGMSYTILRPAAFMEFQAPFMLDPIVKTGKTTLLGSGKAELNLVSAADVAEYVLVALRDPRARGQTIEIGGPENLSGHQVIALFEKVSGRTAKVKHIPLAAVRVMSVALRPVKPSVARLMSLIVWTNTTDQTLDTRETALKYGVPATGLEQVIRQLYC